jgi:hypothetical protein
MGTSAAPRPIQRAITRLPTGPKTFTPQLTRPRSFRNEQLPNAGTLIPSRQQTIRMRPQGTVSWES